MRLPSHWRSLRLPRNQSLHDPVRLDDMEFSDARMGIREAYLAVRNGHVTDQLNVGCNWDEQHYCRFEDGKAHYQLLESGKFKKLD
jgi:hypothetical protein